jgi:hypothetical protein
MMLTVREVDAQEAKEDVENKVVPPEIIQVTQASRLVARVAIVHVHQTSTNCTVRL